MANRSSGSILKDWWSFWYVLFLAISLLCLVLGIRNYFQERAFLAQAELDTGTITQYELHVRNDGKSEYCPRIEFTDSNGQPVAVRGIDCPNAPDQSKIGQTVQIYYDPKNPDGYEQKTAITGLDGLIFGLIGAVFFSLFWFVPLVVAIVRGLQPAANANSGRGAGRNETMRQDAARQDAARYHSNQSARPPGEHQPHAQPAPGARPPAEPASLSADEAHLAQLRQQEAELQLAQLRRQEAELQRKIDEQRRQQGQ